MGGSHKWVYDIVGEKSCTKCGLWKKDTSEVGYSAEKGDYGLGGIVERREVDSKRLHQILNFLVLIKS